MRLFLIAAVLSVVLPAAALSRTDLVGDWAGTMVFQVAKQPVATKLRLSLLKSGVAVISANGDQAIRKARWRLEGRMVVVTSGGADMQLTDLHLRGDELTATVTVPGFEPAVPFTLALQRK